MWTKSLRDTRAERRERDIVGEKSLRDVSAVVLAWELSNEPSMNVDEKSQGHESELSGTRARRRERSDLVWDASEVDVR